MVSTWKTFQMIVHLKNLGIMVELKYFDYLFSSSGGTMEHPTRCGNRLEIGFQFSSIVQVFLQMKLNKFADVD